MADCQTDILDSYLENLSGVLQSLNEHVRKICQSHQEVFSVTFHSIISSPLRFMNENIELTIWDQYTKT